MGPNQYEVTTSLVRRLIDERKEFFLGGRGIGCKITPDKYHNTWVIYFDRARLTFYADAIKVEGGKILFTVDGGLSGHGEVELAHYLKVTVVW